LYVVLGSFHLTSISRLGLWTNNSISILRDSWAKSNLKRFRLHDFHNWSTRLELGVCGLVINAGLIGW